MQGSMLQRQSYKQLEQSLLCETSSQQKYGQRLKDESNLLEMIQYGPNERQSGRQPRKPNIMGYTLSQSLQINRHLCTQRELGDQSVQYMHQIGDGLCNQGCHELQRVGVSLRPRLIVLTNFYCTPCILRQISRLWISHFYRYCDTLIYMRYQI